ncbi:MAG: Crp/Fnr family transcriptional regulator [Alphaproteobacteria bacterium]
MTQQTSTSLAGVRLLQGLGKDALDRLEKQCRWRRYGATEQILDRDDDNRDVLFVVEGGVRVVNFSLSGREVSYANIPQGGFFGELAAIDGQPRSASVVATEKCLLATVPPQAFTSLVREHPDIAMEVMRRLARIIRICDDRIMDLSTLGAVQRVYVELMRMGKPDPAGTMALAIYPLPAHKDIAARASTTRETVARVISQLTQSNIVERRDKALYITDPGRLKELASRLDEGRGDELAR